MSELRRRPAQTPIEKPLRLSCPRALVAPAADGTIPFSRLGSWDQQPDAFVRAPLPVNTSGRRRPASASASWRNPGVINKPAGACLQVVPRSFASRERFTHNLRNSIDWWAERIRGRGRYRNRKRERGRPMACGHEKLDVDLRPSSLSVGPTGIARS